MQSYIAGQWLSDDVPSLKPKGSGLITGTSIYEVIRTYNGIPFAVRKHYERLLKSASIMFINVDFTFEELLALILEGIERNKSIEKREFRIRIVYYAAGKDNQLLLLFEELKPFSKDIYELGVKTAFSPIIRPSGSIVPSTLKIPGNSWYIRTRKLLGDNYDLLLLNEKGNVCEGSFSNLFLIKNENLITPDVDSGVLSGITRELLIDLSKAMDINIEVRPVKSWELLLADEAFLTHTSAGIVPIRKLENRVMIEDFTDGLTRLLLDNYEGFIMSDESNWEGINHDKNISNPSQHN